MAKKRTELYYQLPRNIGLEELTDEEAGKIWKALDRYKGKREHMPNAAMRLVYKNCCDQIDIDAERYDEFCEKQAERIRKRWEKVSNDTTEYHGIPTNTNTSSSTSASPSTSTTPSASPSASTTASATIGGGNGIPTTTPPTTAAESQERIINGLMNDARWMHETSELVMMPIKMMRDEMQKFIRQLYCTGDTTNDETAIKKALLGWLREGKRKSLIENNKNNECRTNNTGGTDTRSDGRNAATDFIDEFCRKAGI